MNSLVIQSTMSTFRWNAVGVNIQKFPRVNSAGLPTSTLYCKLPSLYEPFVIRWPRRKDTRYDTPTDKKAGRFHGTGRIETRSTCCGIQIQSWCPSSWMPRTKMEQWDKAWKIWNATDEECRPEESEYGGRAPNDAQADYSATQRCNLRKDTIEVVDEVGIAAGYTTHAKLTAPSESPSQIPTVGLEDGWFAGLRARLASLGTSSLDIIVAGYKEFSSTERNFILPGIDHSLLLIPASRVKWIVNQADSALDSAAMQKELEGNIRRDLTRSLPSLIPEIIDELEGAIDDGWVCDTDKWNDVVVFETMLKVVAITSNRVFIGLPLCHNEEYLKNAGAFTRDVATSSMVLRMFPGFLKPLVSWLALIPNRWHFCHCSKYLIPVIQRRIADREIALQTGNLKSLPNDFTAWMMNDLDDHPITDRTPRKIALRLMGVNFAAIHTKSKQVLRGNNGKWDKVALAKIIKTDSALRESLRVSTFMSHGMHRLVSDPKGIIVEDGTQIPRGSRLGVVVYAIHHDDNLYPNADNYDTFRFSRAREGVAITAADDAQPGSKENLAKVLESKNLSTVTTSDTFLSFGHG
ncbi:hypothetical protein G7Y89_g7099 [Cudoniella acicularis]|uniref:Uncharacterized protein n=1 Tax=Cudoniella acicularis TaxID=354080 RepID=A0A8H4RJ60_9HELO|nr:hypothetical protein G7Y89_g7099 [Cudoniella acicularis]